MALPPISERWAGGRAAVGHRRHDDGGGGVPRRPEPPPAAAARRGRGRRRPSRLRATRATSAPWRRRAPRGALVARLGVPPPMMLARAAAAPPGAAAAFAAMRTRAGRRCCRWLRSAPMLKAAVFVPKLWRGRMARKERAAAALDARPDGAGARAAVAAALGSARRGAAAAQLIAQRLQRLHPSGCSTGAGARGGKARWSAVPAARPRRGRCFEARDDLAAAVSRSLHRFKI